jgi:hypothetical protein
MNLPRGLSRLWIVTTFAWIIFWTWYFPYCHYAAWARGWPLACPGSNFYDNPVAYVVIVLWLFVPTALAFVGLYVVLMLGGALLCKFLSIATWVIHGFRLDQR